LKGTFAPQRKRPYPINRTRFTQWTPGRNLTREMSAVRPVVKKSVVKHPPCARPRDNHCVRLSGPAKLDSFTGFGDRRLDKAHNAPPVGADGPTEHSPTPKSLFRGYGYAKPLANFSSRSPIETHGPGSNTSAGGDAKSLRFGRSRNREKKASSKESRAFGGATSIQQSVVIRFLDSQDFGFNLCGT
jgi:hypothetical protein